LAQSPLCERYGMGLSRGIEFLPFAGIENLPPPQFC
jgi:hypothetical protein